MKEISDMLDAIKFKTSLQKAYKENNTSHRLGEKYLKRTHLIKDCVIKI